MILDRLLIEKLVSSSDRIASALEKMTEPVEEEEGGFEFLPPPPQCPYCNTINPTITIDDNPGTGNISEFVLKAICGHCKETMWGVVNAWLLHADRSTAIEHVNELKNYYKENKESNSNG